MIEGMRGFITRYPREKKVRRGAGFESLGRSSQG